MRYIRQRDSFRQLKKEIELNSKKKFFQKKEVLNEAFENDITWGGSLLGRLINSAYRWVGIRYKATKIPALVEEFEKYLHQYLLSDVMSQDDQKKASEIIYKSLIEKLVEVVMSNQTTGQKLKIILSVSQFNSLTRVARSSGPGPLVTTSYSYSGFDRIFENDDVPSNTDKSKMEAKPDESKSSVQKDDKVDVKTTDEKSPEAKAADDSSKSKSDDNKEDKKEDTKKPEADTEIVRLAENICQFSAVILSLKQDEKLMKSFVNEKGEGVSLSIQKMIESFEEMKEKIKSNESSEYSFITNYSDFKLLLEADLTDDDLDAADDEESQDDDIEEEGQDEEEGEEEDQKGLLDLVIENIERSDVDEKKELLDKLNKFKQELLKIEISADEDNEEDEDDEEEGQEEGEKEAQEETEEQKKAKLKSKAKFYSDTKKYLEGYLDIIRQIKNNTVRQQSAYKKGMIVMWKQQSGGEKGSLVFGEVQKDEPIISDKGVESISVKKVGVKGGKDFLLPVKHLLALTFFDESYYKSMREKSPEEIKAKYIKAKIGYWTFYNKKDERKKNFYESEFKRLKNLMAPASTDNKPKTPEATAKQTKPEERMSGEGKPVTESFSFKIDDNYAFSPLEILIFEANVTIKTKEQISAWNFIVDRYAKIKEKTPDIFKGDLEKIEDLLQGKPDGLEARKKIVSLGKQIIELLTTKYKAISIDQIKNFGSKPVAESLSGLSKYYLINEEIDSNLDDVQKAWYMFFKDSDRDKWKVDINLVKQPRGPEKGVVEVDDPNTDPIIKIMNIFGKAYRLYATDYIPSGRPEGRVSQRTLREYEYIGSGENPAKPSGKDAMQPGYGPWAARVTFEKWEDGVNQILENKQYRRILANVKFVSAAERETDTEQIRAKGYSGREGAPLGSGTTLLDFITDMLTFKGTFKEMKRTLMKRYFNADVKEESEVPKGYGKSKELKEKGDEKTPIFSPNLDLILPALKSGDSKNILDDTFFLLKVKEETTTGSPFEGIILLWVAAVRKNQGKVIFRMQKSDSANPVRESMIHTRITKDTGLGYKMTELQRNKYPLKLDTQVDFYVSGLVTQDSFRPGKKIQLKEWKMSSNINANTFENKTYNISELRIMAINENPVSLLWNSNFAVTGKDFAIRNLSDLLNNIT